jgi:hypothetical protein
MTFSYLPEVIEATAQVVDEFGPGYIYPKQAGYGWGGCRYVRDGKPSCLVAQVAVRLDLMSIDALAEHEGTGAAFLGLPVDSDAEEFLQCVQQYQDQGWSWGDALYFAQHRDDPTTPASDEYPPEDYTPKH